VTKKILDPLFDRASKECAEDCPMLPPHIGLSRGPALSLMALAWMRGYSAGLEVVAKHPALQLSAHAPTKTET
jgi:hypothetical protein